MKLQIYIGWDPREDVAWQICRHSILTRTDPNEVSISALVQSELRSGGLYTREIDTRAATEFSLTRFLTPTLAGKEGYAIFADCDFLFLTDIREVIEQVDPTKAVSVVKHDYQPTDTHKMDGCVQHMYPRKNWSSLIVFNCTHEKVRALTPTIVNSVEPSFLHRFSWLDDSEIGELDKGWNYLEGVYPAHYNNLKAVHYTSGGPWFDHKQGCDFADLWLSEKEQYQIKLKSNIAA
jgi:hypothetical protein